MGTSLLAVATILVNIFWGGHVSATLWGWFVVPLGVKAITYWHAMGMATVISVFTGIGDSGNRSSEPMIELAGHSLLKALIVPLLCLIIGWIASQNI